MRALLLAGLVLVVGCGASEGNPDSGEARTEKWLAAIPESCLRHPGKEFLGLGVSCTAGEPTDSCAIDRAQKVTPLDGSGNPVMWLCNCFNAEVYSCTYVGDR